MVLWLKLLHILGVVMFIGNITTGVFWHKHAERTRNPRLIAHAMEGVIRSDRLFTIPGVVFMFRLAPLQRNLLAYAQAGAASGSFDYESYHRMAAKWEDRKSVV